jgi:hypothetical protein
MRGVIVPQQLNFLDRPAPKAQLWERLNEEQRATVIDIIARVIGKAVRPAKDTTTDNQEKIHD